MCPNDMQINMCFMTSIYANKVRTSDSCMDNNRYFISICQVQMEAAYIKLCTNVCLAIPIPGPPAKFARESATCAYAYL